MKGSTIGIFSPLRKGWGTATISLALCARLDLESKGRTLLIDIYEEISSIETYVEAELEKQKEYLPQNVFLENADRVKLLLFSSQITPKVFFLKAQLSRETPKLKQAEWLRKIVRIAQEAFEMVVVRMDGNTVEMLKEEMNALITVFGYETGFEKKIIQCSSSKWYRDLLSNANCIQLVNGVPGGWHVSEMIESYSTAEKEKVRIPFNERLANNGANGTRTFALIKEELVTDRSLFSKRIGVLAREVDRIVQQNIGLEGASRNGTGNKERDRTPYFEAPDREKNKSLSSTRTEK